MCRIFSQKENVLEISLDSSRNIDPVELQIKNSTSIAPLESESRNFHLKVNFSNSALVSVLGLSQRKFEFCQGFQQT